MSKRKAVGIGGVALGAVLVVLVLIGPGSTSGGSRAAVSDTPMRGCQARIEGRVDPPAEDDTVIGPVAFTDLPGSYRYARRDPRTPIKAVAVVRPGRRVTLVVPRTQRPWLTMGYGAREGRVTLQACRHQRSRQARERECRWEPVACMRGPTLFSGGFGVRFRRAPNEGLCAELIVRVQGSKQPLRKHLFDPAPGACEPSTG